MSPKQVKTIDDTHEKALKTMAKGTGIVLVGMFIGNFLNYLTRIIIARWLGPSEYGLYNLGLAILGFCTTISLLGLSDVVTRYISFYNAKKDLEKIKGVLYSAIQISLPISFIFSIFVFIFADKISNMFHTSNLIPVLQTFSISIPFSILFLIFISSFRGFKATKYKVYSQDLLYPLSKIILTIYFIYFGYSLMGVTVSYVLSTIIATIFSFFYLSKTFHFFGTVKPKYNRKEILFFSAPLLFSGILVIILGWTDTVMLGIFRTPEEVGIYQAALPTTTILMSIATSFGFIFLPIISELQSKQKDIENIYKSVVRWIFSINLPVFLVMLFFPTAVMKILFGKDFLEASVPLLILSFGYFAYTFIVPSYSILVAINKTKLNFLAILIGAISDLILNFILIPIYGITGAALATTISIILTAIPCLIFVYYYTKSQPFSLSLLKPFVSSLIPIVIFFLIYKFFKLEYWSLFPLFLGFLIVYGLIFLILKGLNEEDLMILKSIEKKTGLEIKWIREFIKRFI